MTDPYKVLGLTREASTDEVKKAYRTLSRKYHPDANINNPHKEHAEEMFKLVQQAYKQIMDERERGYAYGDSGSSSGGYGYGYKDPRDSYGGFGNGWSGWFGGFGSSGRTGGVDLSDPQMQAAANYINAGHYAEAMNVLNDIPNRTPSWYYLRALTNAGLGNNVSAKADAQTAVNMEPDNAQFQQLLKQLSGAPGWYQQTGQGYGYDGCCGNGERRSCSGCGGAGGSILTCCALNALCNCCGMPFSFCCC